MRKYDVAYVPNGPKNYYPVKELEDMTLKEIVQKYLKTCGKSNGDISVCSKCKSPCKEGKRAIQLLANEVYNDPPIPLYGGKTLIERAKEENMKRRGELPDNLKALANALDEAKQKALGKDTDMTEEKKEEKKKKYTKWDGWWETSLESGDQVKWLLDNMGLSKTQAKKKIYQYKYLHGMTGSSAEEKKDETPAPVVNTTMKAFEESLDAKKPEIKPEAKNDNIESKLELLMKQQEDHKKMMDKYMELYKKEKEEYDKIKQKTDILCSAMDILND